MKVIVKGNINVEQLTFETFKIYGVVDYPMEIVVNSVKITNYSFDYTNNVNILSCLYNLNMFLIFKYRFIGFNRKKIRTTNR